MKFSSVLRIWIGCLHSGDGLICKKMYEIITSKLFIISSDKSVRFLLAYPCHYYYWQLHEGWLSIYIKFLSWYWDIIVWNFHFNWCMRHWKISVHLHLFLNNSLLLQFDFFSLLHNLVNTNCPALFLITGHSFVEQLHGQCRTLFTNFCSYQQH